MNQKKLINTTIFIIIIVILIGIVGYFVMSEKLSPSPSPSPIQTQLETIEYINTQYGFSIMLPISWKGYSVMIDKWDGQIIDAQGSTESAIQLKGPKIFIRHPLWTLEVPRQDIPIMIFTPAQWDLISQDKLSVSAAPIGPSELGRNFNYIFALPARYNFAYPIGFEEVEKIIENKLFQAF